MRRKNIVIENYTQSRDAQGYENNMNQNVTQKPSEEHGILEHSCHIHIQSPAFKVRALVIHCGMLLHTMMQKEVIFL